jgi:hypothetical protein
MLGFADGTYMGQANETWQVLDANAPEINFGLVVSSSQVASFLPTTFTINGDSCTIVMSQEEGAVSHPFSALERASLPSSAPSCQASFAPYQHYWTSSG